MQKKGFTLVELLVVIGILAILTAAVVVVLNPAELLRQSRDAQRLSDFDAVRSAISLYLSTANPPAMTTAQYCMVGTVSAFGTPTCTTNATTTVTGGGWVPINFNDLATSTIGIGSPLSALPTDPVNNAAYYYSGAFIGANLNYELDSVLESSKYTGKMSIDGGSTSSRYEVGNNLSM